MRFLAVFLLLVSIKLFSQTVYKTPSGSKYHLSGCRMVKNVSAALTIDKAQREGLSACRICHPPVSQVLGIHPKTKKTAGVNSSNRCFAATKGGTRCKRYTKIGNNFCFQHLP